MVRPAARPAARFAARSDSLRTFFPGASAGVTAGIIAILAAALAAGGILPGALRAQDLGLTPQPPGNLGLSTRRELGLPGAAYDAPSGMSRAQRRYRRVRHAYRRYRVAGPYHYGRLYGDWVPWEPIPQTVKTKIHEPAVYVTPRLGLQYTYPYGYAWASDIGLRLPAERDEPILPASAGEDPTAFVSPALDDALVLMSRGEYARAGRVLSGELGDAVAPFDVYLVIAEILTATGKYSAAAKIFRYGLEEADTLAALDGLDISEHFPSRKEFGEILDRLSAHIKGVKDSGGAVAGELALLKASLRLLSGDAGAMSTLETLQDSSKPQIARAAKRLYLHFVGALFEPEQPEQPAAGAAEKTAPPASTPEAGRKK